MEKINFDLSNKEEILAEFSFSGKTVVVKKFINMTDKNTILAAYFSAVDADVVTQYLTRYYTLVVAVLDVLTNIDIKDIVIDRVVSSGLWHEVSTRIVDLDDIYTDIKRIESELREQQSPASAFKRLIDVAADAIAKVKDMDFSDDGIQKLLGKFEAVKADVGKFYPNIETTEDLPVKKAKPKKTTP